MDRLTDILKTYATSLDNNLQRVIDHFMQVIMTGTTARTLGTNAPARCMFCVHFRGTDDDDPYRGICSAQTRFGNVMHSTHPDMNRRNAAREMHIEIVYDARVRGCTEFERSAPGENSCDQKFFC